MAFNPSSKVAEACRLAKEWSKPIVIIITIDNNDGTISYVSYGDDKELCTEAKRLANIAFDAIVERY